MTLMIYSGYLEVLTDATGRRIAVRETYASGETHFLIPACFGFVRRNQVLVQIGVTRPEVGQIEWVSR